jgi:5-methylcytosine-specific restriction protein A
MPKGFATRSAEAEAHRSWYRLARWRASNGRRAQQLKAEPLCRMCKAKGRYVAGTVADHVIPHRGDERLFWEGELQTVCDALPWRCHSRKQKIEAVSYKPGCDASGRPIDVGHPWNRPRATLARGAKVTKSIGLKTSGGG